MILRNQLILAAGIFCLATALLGVVRPAWVWDLPHESNGSSPILKMVRGATVTAYAIIGLALLTLGAL